MTDKDESTAEPLIGSAVTAAVRQDSRATSARRSMRKHRLGIVGLILVGATVLFAVLGPFLIGIDPNDQSLTGRMLPFWSEANGTLHVLGTDPLGRDVLARLASGAGASLLVAISSLLVGGGLGLSLGLLAGYKGGWFDVVITRLIDAQLAVPNLVFAMIISALVGTGLFTTAIALGFSTWPTFARLIRGETFRVKNKEFVEAAQIVGASSQRLLGVHLLPNVVDAAIVVASLELGRMILLESSLSFIGLGVQAPNASLGTMIRDGQPYVYNNPMLAAVPGLVIVILVLGLNLLGDWLRDVMDPRVSGR